MSDVEKRIDDLRRRVDEIDGIIVGHLNERAKVVLEIQRLKEEGGLPLYDPGREEEIFENVTGANGGPLYDDSLREVYESILHVMKSLG